MKYARFKKYLTIFLILSWVMSLLDPTSQQFLIELKEPNIKANPNTLDAFFSWIGSLFNYILSFVTIMFRILTFQTSMPFYLNAILIMPISLTFLFMTVSMIRGND